MNRTTWIRLERWYTNLNRISQWSVKIGVLLFVICFFLLVTHEPSERRRVTKIVLNCELCGTDPERTISYNEYIERKEQAQKTKFFEDKQQIQQNIWDEHGHERWCRNHPQDRNCK